MIPPEIAEPRVFAEPWQAQAFALTVRLHEQGAFTWEIWAAALSRQRAAACDDGGAGYYECWVAALEILVAQRAMATPDELADTADDWRHAYAATPHGQPVKLAATDHRRAP